MHEPSWSPWRALWRDLPLLNFALYALSIAHAEIANLEPPRPEYVVTFLFPLAVPVLVYAVRWPAAPRRERLLGLAVVGATAAGVAASWLFAPPVPFGREALRRLYEISSILNTALLLGHAWSVDRARLVWLLGPAALYGLLLENGGILLGFFSELHYELYLGPLPAPLATMAGWVLVFYLVTWVTWELRARLPRLRASVAGSAAAATLVGILLDLQIDPIATAVGFWRWNDLLPGALFGVPLVNFVAWGSAIYPFAWLVFWRQTKLGLAPEALMRPPHRAFVTARIPLVLGAAGLLFLLTSAASEGGLGGPTYAVLRATVVRSGLSAPDVAWRP